MSSIKQFFKNASIRFQLLFLFFCMLAICGAAWICANVSELLFFVLLIVIMCVVIMDGYYAIHKTAENYISRYEDACCKEIMKFLSAEYVRIYVFSSSRVDKKLHYYGKVDSDGTISVYGQDKSGKILFQHSTIDYMWFMNNFFTM